MAAAATAASTTTVDIFTATATTTIATCALIWLGLPHLIRCIGRPPATTARTTTQVIMLQRYSPQIRPPTLSIIRPHHHRRRHLLRHRHSLRLC